MRTIAGFYYKCKDCGNLHFLDGEPYDGIRIQCIEKKRQNSTYKKSDFTYWHGYYNDVWNVIVTEMKNN